MSDGVCLNAMDIIGSDRVFQKVLYFTIVNVWKIMSNVTNFITFCCERLAKTIY